MAAQKHAPWQAPGRLLARARRAYRWPAARVRGTGEEDRKLERDCGRVVQGTGTGLPTNRASRGACTPFFPLVL